MKVLFIFSLFIIICTHSLSQNSFGLRGGGCLSKYDYGEFVDGVSENVVSMEIGIFTNFALYKGLFIQPEIGFIQKGGNGKFVLDNLKVKTNQIELATLVGYKIQPKNISIFVNAGIFLGYIFDRKTEGNPFSFPVIANKENDWDWGVQFGGGVGTQAGIGTLAIESRYRFSQSYYRKTTYGLVQGDPLFSMSLKNKCFDLSLSYYIPF